MRKTLSLLLALCMALSLAPAALTTPVSAAVDERSVRFLGAEISNGKINVNVTAGSTVSEAQLVVAAYRKSGQLTGYSSIPIDLSTDSGLFRLDLPENGDFYKVFLLDGSSHPLCAAAEATDIEDYVRAFEQGYVSKSYANADRTAQIRSTTYRAMLVQMIEDLAPEKIHYFDRKVTTFDTPLTRGMAAMMSWYAAECIGADSFNYNFDHTRADGGDFWNSGDEPFESLFPDCFNDTPVETKGGIWPSEYNAAFLWNIWHCSPMTGMQVIAFDEKTDSMRIHEPCTTEDAICAIARLYDSDERLRYVPTNDPEAITTTIAPPSI